MEKVIFSLEDIDQVESLAAGMSVEQVAHYFTISKTTFYECDVVLCDSLKIVTLIEFL